MSDTYMKSGNNVRHVDRKINIETDMDSNMKFKSRGLSVANWWHHGNTGITSWLITSLCIRETTWACLLKILFLSYGSP